MFTKPRRFSACPAPAFVQSAVRPGRRGFFVECSGSVNLLRMERTSLRASSSTCDCHQNLLQSNDVLLSIRSQPLLLRPRSTRFENLKYYAHISPALNCLRFRIMNAFPASARSQSNKIPVYQNPLACRSLSPTLAFDIRSMCRLGLLPAFNLHSFSTQRHVPCCSCRARPQPLELSGGTLAQRPALLQV